VYPEADDIDEQLALREQFSALDLATITIRGTMLPKTNASKEVIDSFTGGDEGGSGGVAKWKWRRSSHVKFQGASDQHYESAPAGEEHSETEEESRPSNAS